MKKIIRIIIALIVIAAVLKTVGVGVFKPATIRAFGDLTVDFHVPSNSPIFTVNNMAPGDPSEERDVDVTNGATIPRYVAVKGLRTGGTGPDPKLETILDIVIKDGATILYGSGSITGPKTVSDFFNDSSDPNGVKLNVINPGQQKTYKFIVTFPPSAGNDFQAKSVIFDLTFGIITGDSLVINEVYYKVDKNHGYDSPKDRGIISQNGKKITIRILGNGAGSNNVVTVKQTDVCGILQSNTTYVQTGISANSNTGSNSTNGNTGSQSTITTGNSSNSANVTLKGGTNTNTSNCGLMLGQNDEWVEIYNPTNRDISLKNWTITDNSGNAVKINANKIVKAGKFALLAKSASTFTKWGIHNALIVEVGSQIGDGLDNSGDHLILKDNKKTEVDRMSWGTDTSGFNPAGINPEVATGNSTERLTPGFDTDTKEDWEEKAPPDPGL